MRFLTHLITLAAALALAAATGAALAQDAAPLKGRIIGLKCAQAGKIGECYLKWAQPMVFINEEGDYYAIDLAPQASIRPEKLDEAFGQEVEVRGHLVAGERIELSELTILRPPAGKEFFKG
jgi:hypothetical protein